MTTTLRAHFILVLDLGSAHAQQLARRIRAAGVYSEVRHGDLDPAELARLQPRGVIVAGTGAGLDPARVAALWQGVCDLGVPVLWSGLAVPRWPGPEAAAPAEPVRAVLQAAESVEGAGELLRTLSAQPSVWLDEQGLAPALPEGCTALATTASGQVAASMTADGRHYGLAFHPELSEEPWSQQLFEAFAVELCGCEQRWQPAAIVDDLIARVRAQVGEGRVLLGLSGGVDSSVVAALLHRAIGDQLVCVFVDHGLLRKDEGDQVMAMFARNMGVEVVRVDAADQFLGRLAGVTDPEAKRKIIGNTFVEVFDERAARLEGVRYLAQGTIYPDVIESAALRSGQIRVIKSHHNVGGLPEDMQLELVEPLRELFKDEVRQLGLELGLPRSMIHRHPFPGPGLGVRILGEVRPEYAAILREADALFIEELRGWVDEATGKNWYDLTSQAFAVFLPIKSVGLVDDARRYEWVIALRAVETIDFMTARWAQLPWDLLDRVSRRIIEALPEVSRVVYDVSSKPPATIEWE